MFHRPMRAAALLAAVSFMGTACLDLQVENLNDPDRDRALAEAGDVESLISGAFESFFYGMHETDRSCAIRMFTHISASFTATGGTCGVHLIVFEPRFPLDNNVVIGGGAGPWGPRYWLDDMSRTISGLNDGLQTIENRGGTLEVGGQDVAPRATAFAKFLQGWAWGTLANTFDQTYYIDENTPVDDLDPIGQGVEILVSYPELVELAIDALQEGAALAEAGNISFPASYFGTAGSVGTEEIRRLANTLSARFLVYNARNKQQRTEVDWGRVLDYTADGVTSDFEIVLAPGVRSSLLYQIIQSQTGSRVDPRLYGQADTSDNFHDWLQADRLQRSRFTVETPDRRITGPDPTDHGAYFRYRSTNDGFSGPQAYLYSYYQWARHAHRNGEFSVGSTASDQGVVPFVTVDENNLLRAEALIRTGELDDAADLINISRTRGHTLPDGSPVATNLPEVTAAGVPDAADCVPRNHTATAVGDCGDLMVALRYERMIELAATDLMRDWHDGRGFGLLPDGTFEQAALDGTQLDVLGLLPVYTFGGGFPFSAVEAPATMDDI